MSDINRHVDLQSGDSFSLFQQYDVVGPCRIDYDARLLISNLMNLREVSKAEHARRITGEYLRNTKPKQISADRKAAKRK